MKKLLLLLFTFSLLLSCLSLGHNALAVTTCPQPNQCKLASDCFTDQSNTDDCGADKVCCVANTCTAPNTCVVAADCAAAEDQRDSICDIGKQCCKPVCTNCKTIAECSGPNLEIDTSMRKCTEAGKVCCKTKSSGGTTTPGGTGGEVIPGDSIDLEQYSPVVASIPELIGLIIKGVLGIVGSIALLMFIYGGFLMLTSQGDPGKIKKGKDALIWASAGLVVIFGSYIFVNYIILGLTGAGK